MLFKPVEHIDVPMQIAVQIHSSILAGNYSPGDKLPHACQLAKVFGVSFYTVRKALSILAAAGVVTSYQESPQKTDYIAR